MDDVQASHPATHQAAASLSGSEREPLAWPTGSELVRSERATPYLGDVRLKGRKQECAAGGAA
jgi:hypothetical protein